MRYKKTRIYREKTGGLGTTSGYRINICRYTMRYFNVFGTYRYHYRENVISRYRYHAMYITRREKRQGKKKYRKTQQKQSCTQVAGRVMRGHGWCLVVVRSVLRCVHVMGNRRTTKKARRETKQEEGKDKEPKQNVGRNKVVRFRWSCLARCFGVTGVISHDISR